MKTSRNRTKIFGKTAGVALLAAVALALSACSGGSGGTGAGTQTDSGGKITVWVDPPRVPAADAFKKAHPEIPINIVQIDGTVGGKTVQQQFAQFDSAKKGWPDAIFFPSNDDIAWATSAKSNYAADMSKETPDLVKGYDPAVLSMCKIGGVYRCLRNDAAPDLFWYNATFFRDNGYTVPTTWEEYATLGAQIAKDHPGFVSGFTGDAYAPDRYLWAAGCPTNDTVSATKVHIDLSDPKCQRAKSILTTLSDAKALSSVGIFDADAATVGPKMVMSPGAVWWGDYLFNQTWKIPAGTMQATAPLTWKGDSKPSTGNEGGGLWGMSSHITGKQLANAKIFMKFVVSDPAWQVELSTGLPAFKAVQADWIAKQSASNYYADTAKTFATFQSAISDVPGDHFYQLYNTGSVWTETVAPALVSGKSFDDAWTAFGTDLNNQAKSQGYTVVKSK
ncbi:ABC transporter substrate-binding protein [Glaciihabitans sp. UYNi722]|uniref:ABC transporter substrate-binding protein n=1 Tax=Glaciihabitans sp. UYNi722 TaxID=3156344 RepID=UPI00339A8EA8